MRKNNKLISFLLAAIMITAGFFAPIMVYANEETGDPVDIYGEYDEGEYADVSEMDEFDLSGLFESLDFAELLGLLEMYGLLGQI